MADIIMDLADRRARAIERRIGALRAGPGSPPGSMISLHIHEREFEEYLVANPSGEILDTIVRAKYLLQIFSETKEGQKEIRLRLIQDTLRQIDGHFEDGSLSAGVDRPAKTKPEQPPKLAENDQI